MDNRRKTRGVSTGMALMFVAIGIIGLVFTSSQRTGVTVDDDDVQTQWLELSPPVDEILMEEEEQTLRTLDLENPDTANPVVTVSADGVLSDLLIPGEDAIELENMDKSAYDFTVSKDAPIIIYHTHTTEAYRQVEGYEYEATGEMRTEDNSKNIVAVGAYLKELLEGYGYTVIHDTTDHEPPSLSSSYERSVVTMEHYKELYPNARLFIDLHRDAAGEALIDDYVMVDGKETARIMFVVGRGDNYSQKPFYESNYAFADILTESLEDEKTGLTREIRVKTGRYNQHISDMCILVEAGHNQNTFEQALNSMEVFAKTLNAVV